MKRSGKYKIRRYKMLLPAALLTVALLLGGCVSGKGDPDGDAFGETEEEEGGESSEGESGGVTGTDSGKGEESVTKDREGSEIPKESAEAFGAGGSALEVPGAFEEPVFTSEAISDEIFARMYGKSYKEDCTVPREELRYLRISCIGFDGEPYVGELVANEAIADDLLEIFRELYEAAYPIEKMRLIDEYDADDEASMADDNTSCFNFRKVSGSERLSNHSYGKAIDINPLYNPYIRTSGGTEVCEPAAGEPYMDRTPDFPYKIDEDDLCCRLFKEHGFTWGGDWNSVKDYQHFERE